MKETSWTITARDGAAIHGRLNHAEKKSNHCVVMVHGLTGNMQEYQHKAGALFFAAQGYDVFRFDLYGEEKGARRLRDCTLTTHAADLQDVLAEKTAGYDKIFLIGHSYGGPTIMLAQPKQAAAISLWDPSFDLPHLWGQLPASEENGYCIEGRGVEVLLNPAMMTETHLYDRENCLALSRTLGRPIQVIHAEHCIYNAPDEISWHSAGHPDNERHLIKGADHCFVEGDTLAEALGHSWRWFSRYA